MWQHYKIGSYVFPRYPIRPQRRYQDHEENAANSTCGNKNEMKNVKMDEHDLWIKEEYDTLFHCLPIKISSTSNQNYEHEGN